MTADTKWIIGTIITLAVIFIPLLWRTAQGIAKAPRSEEIRSLTNELQTVNNKIRDLERMIRGDPGIIQGIAQYVDDLRRDRHWTRENIMALRHYSELHSEMLNIEVRDWPKRDT